MNDESGPGNEWPGFCAVCEHGVLFRSQGPWHRDQLVCATCGSIPRQRALITVLGMVRPDWPRLRIWELAPVGPTSEKLRSGSPRYIGSQFWPDVEPGTLVDGIRCENLERATLDDSSVDVVVSSDVFEHIVDVDAALAEVARVLAPGGVHVWTTPQYRDRENSTARVRRSGDSLEYLVTPEYHGDPVNPDGALVTIDWGRDLPDRIARAAGMWTMVVRLESRAHGLLGEFLEVFVSGKGPPTAMAIDVAHADMSITGEIERLSDALAVCRRTVEAMEASRSWRLTRPARRLAGLRRRTRSERS